LFAMAAAPGGGDNQWNSAFEDADACKVTALQMTKRLKELNDLNSQLKGTIRARHREVEALLAEEKSQLDKLVEEKGSPMLKLHLYEESELDGENGDKGRAEMEAQAAALEAKLSDLTTRNNALRRQNRRMASLLAVDPSAKSSAASDIESSSASPCRQRQALTAKTSNSSQASASTRLPAISPRAATAVQFKQQRASSEGSSATHEASWGFTTKTRKRESEDQANAGTAAAAEAGVALWRGQDGLHGVLHEFLEGVEKILRAGQSKSSSAMLYIIDDWMKTKFEGLARKAQEEAVEKNKKMGFRPEEAVAAVANRKQARLEVSSQRRPAIKESMIQAGGPHGPSIYYLAGKVTIHGYRRLQDQQPQPPVFADVASLPLRSSSALVLPMQAGPGQHVLAVLQIINSGTSQATDGEEESAKRRGGLQLSEAQITGLHLLCSLVVGILDIHLRITKAVALRGRARDILGFTSEINSAKDLTFFEQRAKQLSTEFFPNAASVLLSWYDPVRHELISTDTRPRKDAGSAEMDAECAPAVGRRNIARVSAQDGVAGQCIRTRKVSRGNASSHEKATMLVGPLVAKLSNGHTEVVGIMEMTSKKTPVGITFSEEDELFFAELMNIIGLAARRTMRAQAATGAPTLTATSDIPRENEIPNLDKLLLA